MSKSDLQALWRGFIIGLILICLFAACKYSVDKLAAATIKPYSGVVTDSEDDHCVIVSKDKKEIVFKCKFDNED